MTTLAVAYSSIVPQAVSLRQQGKDFPVTCSRTATATEVRAALLTEHFGYPPEDIEALVLATGFKISDTRAPKTEATPKQIASWPRDPQGRVSIHLSDWWVDRITTFRNERVRACLAQAASSIADPVMRAKWIEAMQKIITDSDNRGASFIELMNSINGSGQPRSQYVAALESLQKTTAGTSPYVELALATLALEDARTLSGPGYDAAALQRLEAAMKRLDSSTLGDGTGGGLTRADAEVINRQAARIQNELGDEDGANRREWVARWLGMRDEERAEYEEGDVVELNEPGVVSMSAPTKTSRELGELDADWAERQRMEQKINGIGAQTLPNFPNDEKLLNQGTENVEVNGAVLIPKRRQDKGNKGYVPRYRVSTVNVPLRNPTQLENMKGASGAVDLFNTVGKFIAADRRMRELSDYLARRAVLQRRLRNQRFRTVPPKPAKVKAAIDRLIELDRRTTDVRTKQELQTAIAALRTLLEESRAAWP